MYKLMFILLMSLCLGGCGFKYGLDPDLIPTTTQRVTFNIKGDLDKAFNYIGLKLSDQSLRLPANLNQGCLSEDSITVIVTSVDDEAIFLNIGGDCTSLINEGLSVYIFRYALEEQFEMDLSKAFTSYEIIRVHFKLPDGYIAEDCIDFLNYGYRIEFTGKMAPLN